MRSVRQTKSRTDLCQLWAESTPDDAFSAAFAIFSPRRCSILTFLLYICIQLKTYRHENSHTTRNTRFGND